MLDIIIKTISQKFPDSFVFNEKVSKNYDENCFIVWQNTGELQKLLKNRYCATLEYSVFYYSEDNLESMATILCGILSDLGDYKSQKLSYKINENTLEVIVTYKTFLLKGQDLTENMEKFDFQIKF